MAHLNEEKLPRFPVEDEEMLDEHLRDIFLKNFNTSNELLSHVTAIGVTSDNELARSMRTGDPRRENVVASVSERVALVKEIAKATVSELSRLDVVERVFKLSRKAKSPLRASCRST
ncbi:unnamed protein product [Haemonchus placei]|uniref:Mediator complex subunit 22 n=1 Tax=Haemonchus placei TaxID=6290 RepID=A0A0N4WXG9_HAEPC|nr:unnamed protein product [Haemonchus placei]